MNSRIAWLEAEHYEKAGNINQNIDDENNQWKTYLNNLAYLGFEEWLQRQLPDMRIQPKGVNLKVDKFKVQLITVDNLIDDFVPIPHSNINSPYLAAHFYILVEVLEEMEHLRIHGLIRHDELSKLRDNIQNNTNDYQIPLSCFDNQINNLLHYTRFLEVNAIPIPDIKDEVITNLEKIKDTVTQSLINLGQWWSGEFGEVWQSLEDILTPQTPAWGYPKNITRRGNVNKKSSDYAVRRGKLLDFGLLLNGQRFALTLSMRAEENQEIGVLVQIRPQNEYCLPQDLKLRVTLNHNTEQAESEEAIARECDQIIQLAFSEAHGKQFKVEAIYQDAVVTEEFEL
ncbi:MAG: DUF1822 family protein [Cyanobacteria bacterium P01_A01_bin.68]